MTINGTTHIPTIDLSPANPQAPSQLLDAATKHGFVFIENNATVGISPTSIAHMFTLSQQFFASPLETKQQVAIGSNKAGANHGWLSRGIEMLDPATQKRADVKEAFNMGMHSSGRLSQPLPVTLQPHLFAIVEFQNACYALCRDIFRHLAIALGIEEDWFVVRHDRSRGPSGTVLRLLYYPQIPDMEVGVDIRAGAHSDFGSVTLLFQVPGQPGLEIQTARGEWASVPVDPLAGEREEGSALPILVNIGDLLQDWTGGLLRSTVHRVIFPKVMGGEEGGDRYSIAYFEHPLDEATLEPVPSEVVREHVKRTGGTMLRNGMTARDHLMERLSSTYHLK